MKSYIQAFSIMIIALAFWVYLGWSIASIFDQGLIGAAVGFLIFIAGVVFAYTNLKNVVIRDMEASFAKNGAYPELNRAVADICYKENIPKPQIYVAPDHAPHALSVGLSPASGAIIVTKGLLETLNEDELKAYVCHEIVHLKRGHHYTSDLGAGIAYFILLPTRLFDNINEGENLAKLISLYLLGLFAMIFVQMASYRWIDYDTDKEAAEIHGQGFSLASALNSGEKARRKHPIIVPHYCAHLFTVEPLTQHTPASALFYTHLSTPKRITRLKRMSKKISKKVMYKNKGLT